jgi:hypothetical protein
VYDPLSMSEILMLGSPLLGMVSLHDQPLNVPPNPNPNRRVEPAPIKIMRSFVYLADEQRSPVPYVQVHGK